MKRMLLGLLMVPMVLTCMPMAPANASSPSAVQYCSQVWKQFPNGVARTSAAAGVAANSNLEEPAVNAKYYRAHRGMDSDGDGVICPRKLVDPMNWGLSAEQVKFKNYWTQIMSARATICKDWTSPVFREQFVADILPSSQAKVTPSWAFQTALRMTRVNCPGYTYMY